MINTSTAYKTAIKSNVRELLVKATIETADIVYELTGEDIVSGSVSVDWTLMSGSLELGSAIASNATITLKNNAQQWNDVALDGAMLRIYSGIRLPDDTVEYVLLGTFIIDDAGRPYSQLAIKASDRLILLDEPFSKVGILAGATHAQAMLAISTYCNVPLAPTVTNSLNMTERLLTLPDGDPSCRDIVQGIALLSASNVRMTRQGLLEFVPLKNPITPHVMTPQDRFSFKELSDEIVITGLEHEDTLFGTDDYPLVVNDAKIYIGGPALVAVYSTVVPLRYTAYTATYAGDPSIEAGDRITHETRDGKTIQSIVTRHQFKHGGQSTIQADGKSRSELNYKSENSRRIAQAVGKAEAQLTETISAYAQHASQLSDMMGLMQGVFPSEETLEDGSLIKYWHDKPTRSESQTIWQFNGLTLTWSNDGGSTWSGVNAATDTITAKILSVLEVNANRVIVSSGNTLDSELGSIRGEIDTIELTPGEDGVSSYLHTAYANSADGSVSFSTSSATNRAYFGQYVSDDPTPSENHSDYVWALFKGDKGETGLKGDQGPQGDRGPQGVKGDKGEDGEPTYTWIRYADTATGVGISNTPTGKLYVGFAYNKPTATESNEPTDYKWSLIKGEKGEQGNQGVEGAKGADGQPTYTWIKYSANSDGTGLVDTPDANTKYIGIAVNKLTKAESGNKGDYTWSKYVGDKGDKGDQGDQGDRGPQGVKGDKGDDGIQRYTWIRYADTSTGQGINNNPTGKLYIGFAYNKTTATESNEPTDYKWSLIKGEKGEQGNRGVKGEDGEDGNPTYTWIKYSANADGTGLVDNPTANTKYIGIAVNKLTQSESSVKTDYTWSKFIGEDGAKGDKGDTGAQGVKGDKGDDGIQRYTWIRYADTSTGGGINNSPVGKLYIGFAYNKTTATESNTPSDYKWSLIKGDKGEQGNQGVKGEDGANGQPTYTWIKYSANSNGSGLVDVPNANTKYIGIAVNKLTKSESNTPADYTWSKFIGDDGAKGDKGEQGVPGIRGNDGNDGEPRYIWIRYADDENGNGMSDYPADKDFIGVAGNKTTSVESDTASDYTWSRINDHSRLDELGQLQEELQQAVQVGGRNLFSPNPPPLAYQNYHSHWAVDENSISTTFAEGGASILTMRDLSLTRELRVGEDFTMSGFAKVNGEIPDESPIIEDRIQTQLPIEDRGTIKYNNETGYFYVTVNWSSVKTWIIHASVRLVAGDTLTITDFKVESGPLPTAYSRAPEDIEADIAKAQADATESIQRVIWLEDGQLKFSERIEDAEGNIQNFTTITEMINGQLVTKVEDEALATAKKLWQDGLLEKADQAQFDLLKEGWVEEVNGLSEWGANFKALEERTEDGETFYVEVQRRFRWDEDWITIGKEGSSKQVQITDEALNIIDGGEISAYFAGQQTHVENMIVNQDTSMGNHTTSKYGTSGEITVERWNG